MSIIYHMDYIYHIYDDEYNEQYGGALTTSDYIEIIICIICCFVCFAIIVAFFIYQSDQREKNRGYVISPPPNSFQYMERNPERSTRNFRKYGKKSYNSQPIMFSNDTPYQLTEEELPINNEYSNYSSVHLQKPYDNLKNLSQEQGNYSLLPIGSYNDTDNPYDNINTTLYSQNDSNYGQLNLMPLPNPPSSHYTRPLPPLPPSAQYFREGSDEMDLS